ncbi:hypothetical protein DENSPDRAFT_874983 [Dentipellis sp. KUC8613]|nr:hypothetical protein DENSPDRAFT_874983 [Dentipellis sp. KUC8613]
MLGDLNRGAMHPQSSLKFASLADPETHGEKEGMEREGDDVLGQRVKWLELLEGRPMAEGRVGQKYEPMRCQQCYPSDHIEGRAISEFFRHFYPLNRIIQITSLHISADEITSARIERYLLGTNVRTYPYKCARRPATETFRGPNHESFRQHERHALQRAENPEVLPQQPSLRRKTHGKDGGFMCSAFCVPRLLPRWNSYRWTGLHQKQSIHCAEPKTVAEMSGKSSDRRTPEATQSIMRAPMVGLQLDIVHPPGPEFAKAESEVMTCLGCEREVMWIGHRVVTEAKINSQSVMEMAARDLVVDS